MFTPSTDTEEFWAQTDEVEHAYTCAACVPGEHCRHCNNSGRVPTPVLLELFYEPILTPPEGPPQECPCCGSGGDCDGCFQRVVFECPACSHEASCDLCNGKRFVRRPVFVEYIVGRFLHIVKCPSCDGDEYGADLGGCRCSGLMIVPKEYARDYVAIWGYRGEPSIWQKREHEDGIAPERSGSER